MIYMDDNQIVLNLKINFQIVLRKIKKEKIVLRGKSMMIQHVYFKG